MHAFPGARLRQRAAKRPDRGSPALLATAPAPGCWVGGIAHACPLACSPEAGRPVPAPCLLLQEGKLSQGARLTAGLGAGVSEALLIVTPFEVVKTRLQQQRGTDKALLKYRVRAGGAPSAEAEAACLLSGLAAVCP